MGTVSQKTEVVIHVTDDLDEASRGTLESELEKEQGIYSAEFCPIHHHLMLVNYDREGTTSRDVLGHVSERTTTARLIGPI
jgi:hypothetical protein